MRDKTALQQVRDGDTNGVVIWRGPSRLDGAPIALVAIGFHGASNGKTGSGLVQTYIIREDMPPAMASQTGADASICGSCGHRGRYKYDDLTGALARIAGTHQCYVNLGQGPLMAYERMHSGQYPDATPRETARLFRGLMVRIGAYGDGAAVPRKIWERILRHTIGRTGYSHQWRMPSMQWLQQYCMASVDTVAEMHEARTMGWRTFRVAPAVGWTKEPGEGLCPASEEAGKALQCDTCKLCSGTAGHGRASIMIPDHGPAGRAAKARAANGNQPRVVIRRVKTAA